MTCPGHRDVVAARGRQIAHRHDERLVLARQHQGAPDHVRGDRRSARAVDAQDDRLDAAIVRRLVDVFDERVRTGDVAAPPVARRDRPDRVDHRDLRPRAEGEGRRQRLHVVGEVGGVLVAQADVLLDLVAIQQGVDEPGRERVLGDERPLVDQRPDRLGRLLAGHRDRLHQLIEGVVVQRRRHLAVRRGEGLLGEGVDRRLVVADVDEIGGRADLVERPAQEHFVGGEALEVEHARRQEHHLLARRGEEVLLLAAVLEVGDRLLAGLAEVDDGVADFLAAGPERRAADRLHHEALHPPVRLGAADRVDQHPHRRRPLDEPIEQPGAFHLAEVAVQAEDQRRARGHARPPPGQRGREPDADRRQQRRNGNQSKNEPNASTGGHSSSLSQGAAVAATPSIEYSARGQPGWRPGRASATLRVSRPRARPHLLCGSGGMADALASGASPGNRVEVQVLSSAPLCGARRPQRRPRQPS